MSESQSPMMTRLEAGVYLRVHGETVLRWAEQLKWQVFYDPMGRVRFLRSEVEAALSNRPPAKRQNRGHFRPKFIRQATA